MLIQGVFQLLLLNDQDLAKIDAQDKFVFDVECYPNLFHIGFKNEKTGAHVDFTKTDKKSNNFNTAKLNWMLWRFCLISFNGINYDIPMITLALLNFSCLDLKKASDFIIKENKRVFDFEIKYDLKIPKYNHIDLINVAPLSDSLKKYAARLHCEKMQELPYDPDKILNDDEIENVIEYCKNDQSNTLLLYKELTSEIKLRSDMSLKYEVDLRSKSDAQIAESVICKEIQKETGLFPKKPFFKQQLIKYKAPDFIKFESENLNSIFALIKEIDFELDLMGSPILPDVLKSANLEINNKKYTIGMGGIHSNEKSQALICGHDEMIVDNDVESFYPRIILNQNLYPKHLGVSFLNAYSKIVSTRIESKKQAKIEKNEELKKVHQITADSLKITINGSFGKFGNKWSTLYSPDLMLQVTITGQLVLLMLIERFELAGLEVFSANTDGFISKYKKEKHKEARKIIQNWENETNFKTEETQYKSVYSRDVNSYVAHKINSEQPNARFEDEKLGLKVKGAFSEKGSALNSVLSKNPENLICLHAVYNYIVNKTPIDQTIKNCKNIRLFVSVRSVKGGGEQDGLYLGKVVRFYYSLCNNSYINYVVSKNKVANSKGAKPLMNLPLKFPNDIDYSKYIKIADDMLFDLGVKKENELF